MGGIRIAATASVLLAIAGCYSSSVLPTPAPERADVRMRFDPPRRVAAASARGDTVQLEAVTEVSGRLLAVRGDTLHVELIHAGAGQRVVYAVRGRTTLLVPQSGRPAEMRRISPGRTFAAIVLPPVIGYALLAIYLTCCWEAP